MKIKLVAPKMSLRPMDTEFKRRMVPSMSLLVLAALTPDTHDLEIIDENTSPINDFSRADLVGITCTVDTFDRARTIASRFRASGTPVIMGGIFPSACPEIAGQASDSVCVGYAEPLWADILADAQKGSLQKLYRCSDVSDLRMVPHPKWDAISRTRYLYTNVVTTSRGCPHQCDFCYNSCEYVPRRYLRRPVDSTVREIEQLDTKQVMFVDDNFIGNTTWLDEFLTAIAPLDLTWHAAVSADIGNKLPLLDKMQETGCHSLFIGFESINQASIAGVMKRQNRVVQYERTIQEIHSRGIMVNASMVFGFDQDTSDVFDDTLQWLVNNRVETMTAHILTPYPGTMLHTRLEKEGRITDRNLSHYNTSHVVYRPALMSPDELLDGYLNIYKDFYSARNIVRRMPESRDRWFPYLLFNLGYRKFGAITSTMGRFGLMSSLGRIARKLSYGIG
jgi:radical SAM superfamily enzyme YgiQ (UPF0313 family)